jgi:hypothetical protein
MCGGRVVQRKVYGREYMHRREYPHKVRKMTKCESVD